MQVDMKRELSLEMYDHFYRRALTEQAGKTKRKAKSEVDKGHQHLYYRQCRPVFLILRLFGRTPLSLRNNGEYSARWVSWWMLYCVLAYSLQTYLAVIVCARRVQAMLAEQAQYDDIIFSIQVLAYVNLHFHVPLSYWLQAGRLVPYLRRWAELQEDWRLTFGAPFRLIHGRALRLYLCLVVPLIFLFLFFEQYATLRDPPLLFIPYFFTLVSTALVLGLWVTTCLEVRHLAEQLAQKLIQRLEAGQRVSPWVLSRWRGLWLDLRGLTEQLGTALCAVLVSLMLTFSTTFLLGLYNGLVQLMDAGPSWKALGYLTASFSSLAVVFLICDGGHRATSGVVPYTLSALLKGKLSMVNQDIRHEIYLIMEVVKADPPEIKLGGFVTLNRPLVVSLVSNTLTYLIVLLQFKVNEER